MSPQPTKVVGQRVLAFAIDFLIWAAIVVVFWLLLTEKFDKDLVAPDSGGFDIGDKRYAFSEESSNRGIWTMITLLSGLAIFIVWPAINGASPGRLATGIRVVDGNGRAPGLRMIPRAIVAVIVDWFPWFFPIVAIVTMLVTDKNQRVSDKVSGTYTVRKEAAGQPIGGQPAQGQPAQGQPAHSQAAAGWHPDPKGEARLRYWDGSSWTEHTSA
jgi:uncharacterized RDD family membrane protein YckC